MIAADKNLACRTIFSCRPLLFIKFTLLFGQDAPASNRQGGNSRVKAREEVVHLSGGARIGEPGTLVQHPALPEASRIYGECL